MSVGAAGGVRAGCGAVGVRAGEHASDVGLGVVVGVERPVEPGGGAGVAQVGRGGVDGVVWVVPRRRIGSAGRRRMAGGDGGEGGGEELHRPGCAGTVLTAGDAGETGAAVVGLDFPDGGQDRPVQARTGLGRRNVEPQIVRWNVAAGARARRADPARRTATALNGGPDGGPDCGDQHRYGQQRDGTGQRAPDHLRRPASSRRWTARPPSPAPPSPPPPGRHRPALGGTRRPGCTARCCASRVSTSRG